MPTRAPTPDMRGRRDPRPAQATMGRQAQPTGLEGGVVIESHPLIEDILEPCRERLGRDFDAYRGHVYRVFNLCIHGANARDSEIDAIAAAAAFHDLAIWTNQTFDYIEASCVRAERWIISSRRGGHPIRTPDAAAIALMISEHHKLTRYRGAHERLVEAFRRADLMDLSLGLLPAGLSRKYARKLRRQFPNAGFHRALLRIGGRWAAKHPTRPFPMIKF